MELLDALSETFDHAAKVIAGVGPDQLDDAHTVREWNVRDLALSHPGVRRQHGAGRER